jgi:hypothetical protein
MSEFFWIQERDRSSNTIGYYTREPDGLSGMTPDALAQIVLVSSSDIQLLLNKLSSSSTEDSDIPLVLKTFAGQNFNLALSENINDFSDAFIIPDFLCQEIINYYTVYAPFYEGQQTAINNKATLLSGAVKLFIWSKTGHKFDRGQESYWYKRIKLATSSKIRPIQKNYFSIYLKMMPFFLEMETKLDYIIPDFNPAAEEYLVPDISIGRGFNSFLKSNNEADKIIRKEFLGSDDIIDFSTNGKNNREVDTYIHIYPEESHPNGNKHNARAYPIKYSGIFDYYLINIWIPKEFIRYIGERDSLAVQYLTEKINKMDSGEIAVQRNSILGGVIDLLRPRIKGS